MIEVEKQIPSGDDNKKDNGKDKKGNGKDSSGMGLER
jgi:hypothetical protein